MVFNWFKRKFSDGGETETPEPEIVPTEDAAVEQSDAHRSDDEDSSSAEDYLAWAQAAFQNLQDQSSDTAAVEPSATAESEAPASSTAPEVSAPEPDTIEPTVAVVSETVVPEPEDTEAPEPEAIAEPKTETQQKAAIEETIESPEPEVSEPDPTVGQPQAEPTSPAPATSAVVSEPLEMDEGFRWSAEVLAAQGRKVEEVSAEEITWLKKLRTGLGKTRRGLVNQLKSVVGKGPLSQDAIEEIETLLLQADVGIQATDVIVESLQQKLKEDALPSDEAIAYLKALLRNMLDRPYQKGYTENFAPAKQKLNIWLMAGVNGVGKTTTIGKLTNIATSSGYSCLIAAADTFRAAAVEQVRIWGERSQVDVICNPGQNTDPAAVVFDAISAAQSRNVELLLVDTAGRLQNKKNLMDELSKVRRIIEKKAPEANVESLLVLDATLGQNGLRQAQVFAESAKLTGVVLTKLDGTAKGGVALGVVQQLGLPIRFIGAGEGIADLRPFSSYEFVEALLAG